MSNRILSLCGGGVRGCVSACALVELERQTGKLTRDVFSFVAGTSTGALIASSVAVGLPATQILKIYEKRAREIFNHGTLKLPLQMARGYAYEPENIRRVLGGEFGAVATWKMSDCPIKVLITAVGMNGHSWFFVPANPKNSGLTAGVSLIDAAVASSAAPFYFDHATVQVGITPVRLFDGGITGLANPTYQAAVEAFEFDSYIPSETKIITLGTGFFSHLDVPPHGLLEVIGWTIDTLIDSSQDWVDQATERQWPKITTKWNCPLLRPIDMGSVADIPELVALGKREAAKLDWEKNLG